MPRARLMLNVPAASAAPVPPAQTSACARPSATARAACTIDACGRRARRARPGPRPWRSRPARRSTSTPARQLAQLPAGPNRSTRAPWLRPRSPRRPRPRPVPGRRRCSRRPPPVVAPPAAQRTRRARPLASRPLGVVVLVIVIVRARRHDLTARVGAAHRAHPVRAARAVALRARVTAGAPILCCARRLAVRLCDCFFLGTAIGSEGYQACAARATRARARAASPSAGRARARGGARDRPR